MSGFFRKRGLDRKLEPVLRRASPRARDEFKQSVISRIESRRGSRFARLALVGAATAALIVPLASFGGLASAAFTPAAKVAHLAHLIMAPPSTSHARRPRHARIRLAVTSGQGQYKFLVCHHPPGNPSNYKTLDVGSQAAVNAHVANHPGDHPGPCVPPNG